jgi:drug/metabolite transporter (DMT)-like permease
MPNQKLSHGVALILLGIVVLTWGVNWPMTKAIVREVPPLWSTAMRCAIASVVLGLLLWLRGEFIIPRRGDVPVVLSTSLLHMTAYSALTAFGLRYLPAGRAIVLGYTTPLWVTLGARVFLSEAITPPRALGVGFGLAGLAVIFSPGTMSWGNRDALIGSGLILLAACFWAANIVYLKVHRWISTPFQLVFWQVLLACTVLSITAALVEGAPHINWTTNLMSLLLFSGVMCTALAHWAMTMVNRSLPAVTTSLGLLGTPVVGIVSGVATGEPYEASTAVALALIVAGIVIGIVGDGSLGLSRREPLRTARPLD